MAQKPSIPKGTRDFSPKEMSEREYIISTVRESFKKYGFSPIETPSFENMSTLMGKYGEEGDRLIFKILNSGDYLQGVDPALLTAGDSLHLTSKICEKALRYDLTVPFARYVVQHQGEITFPFKRYQIQPVWRADRPQKGRYREFYQCDADVVGSSSLWQEVELVGLYDEVFSKLNIPVTIKVNNRKILGGIAEAVGAPERVVDITVALDKLDKIGQEGVENEMREKGIAQGSIEKLRPLIAFEGDRNAAFEVLEEMLRESETGKKGIEELRFIFDAADALGLHSAKLELDLTLARGLNYYTGAIFEVKAQGVSIGSIGGGGRYDDLTGIFGLKGVSGVGISFGLDRIHLVMAELELFPSMLSNSLDVLFLNFGYEQALYSLRAIAEVRQAGLRTELYPDNAKIGKQLDYANKKGIRYVVMAGGSEMENNTFTVKDMSEGSQKSVSLEQLIQLLKG